MNVNMVRQLSGCAVIIAITARSPGSHTRATIIDLRGAPALELRQSFAELLGFRALGETRGFLVSPSAGGLLLVDFSANTLRAVGRPGEAAGEFGAYGKPMAGPDSTTYLIDGRLHRVNVISAGGAVVKTMPYVSIGRSIRLPSAVDAQGRVYGVGTHLNDPRPSAAVQRWNPATGRADTVTWLPYIGEFMTPSTRPPSTDGFGPGYDLHRPIFSTSAMWSVLPDGRLFVIHSTPPHVEVLSEGGAPTRGTNLPFAAIPVSATDRAALIARHLSEDEIPPTKPPFNTDLDLVLGSDNSAWVPLAQRGGDSIPVYVVFNDRAQLTDSVLLRPNSRIVGVAGQSVFVASQSQGDRLWHLLVYRVRR